MAPASEVAGAFFFSPKSDGAGQGAVSAIRAGVNPTPDKGRAV